MVEFKTETGISRQNREENLELHKLDLLLEKFQESKRIVFHVMCQKHISNSMRHPNGVCDMTWL